MIAVNDRARAEPEASTAVIDQSGEVKALREELAVMRKIQAARPPEDRTSSTQLAEIRACRESEATAKKQLKQIQKHNKVPMVSPLR